MGGGKDAKGKSKYPALAHHPVGQWITGIYKERIAQFSSRGQWETVNLLSYAHPLPHSPSYWFRSEG